MIIFSCTDEQELSVPFTRKLNVTLDITLTFGQVPDTKSEYESIGKTEENAISNFVIFIVGLDNSGNELWDTVEYHWFLTPEWTVSSESYSSKKQIETTSGIKHIYIGANFTTAQIDAFITNEGKSYAMTGNDYLETISDLADFNSRGMVMTGIVKAANSTEIEISSSGDNQEIAINCELVRLLAKILLICETEEKGGVKYAKIETPTDSTGGWMKLANVYFSLNTVNRQVNLIQQTEGGRIIDPNYKSGDLVEKKDNVYQIKNSTEYWANFLRLYFFPEDDKFDWEGWHPVLEFDNNKLLENDPANHYTEGLYCPENTLIVSDLGILDESDLVAVTKLTTTQLVVAGKFVPRVLITETGEEIFGSEEEAKVFLPEKTEFDNSSSNTIVYPEGTFWFYDNEFYTYKGMLKKHTEESQSIPRDFFQTHLGGWGFYTTYVDGVLNESEGKLFFDEEKSGVLRNFYYILSVSYFNVPGAPSITDKEEPMKVSLKKMPWNYRGSTEVTIDPSETYD